MRIQILWAAALVFLVFSTSAFCGSSLSKEDQDALKDTQDLLHDEVALKNFTKNNPDAAKALDQVRMMTGGNQQQMNQVSDISSNAFTYLVKKHHGDSAAIQAELQQALKDPKAFMNSLPAAEQAQIRGLASEIEKKNPPAAK